MASASIGGGLLLSSASVFRRLAIISSVASSLRVHPTSGCGLLSALRPSRDLCCCCSGTPQAQPLPLAGDALDAVAPPAADPLREAADALDIRVGCVLKAWRHPEADSLYVEEVDVGEAEPRTICSGLINFVPLEHLQDRNVVVLANLKPRNMRGIKSNGMLMAASDESHQTVELLIPPEGSLPGERIWFGEEDEKDRQPDAATPNQVQKKKIWEAVQPHLRTTDTCMAVLGRLPMRTSAGTVVCDSLKNARIS